MLKHDYLNGVNLGGWLVLERWMTPSVFKGTAAEDEYTLCSANDPDVRNRLRQHRDSFITEKDFAWIANAGYNAVRLPVGYWALADKLPFMSTKSYVDFAFAMCEKHNLKIVLQLHAAPGSQNGAVHSGRAGNVGWPTNKSNIIETIKVLRELAERYGQRECLAGIGLLNEPSITIPAHLLKAFYADTYTAIKPLLHKEVRLLISSRFRPLRSWLGFVFDRRFVFDNHYYLNQNNRDNSWGAIWLYTKLTGIYLTQHILGAHRSFIGEYTYRLPDKVANSARVINRFQDFVYKRSLGSFYWNYKTETNDAWSLRIT